MPILSITFEILDYLKHFVICYKPSRKIMCGKELILVLNSFMTYITRWMQAIRGKNKYMKYYFTRCDASTISTRNQSIKVLVEQDASHGVIVTDSRNML